MERAIALSDTLFQLEGRTWQVSFHPEPDGSVERGTLVSQPEQPVLRRTQPWHPSPAELKAYAGRYYSSELETIYTLIVDEGQLVSEHRWNEDMRFEPQERDMFWGGRPFQIVKFERDQNGGITGFVVSAGPTSNVRFEKQ